MSEERLFSLRNPWFTVSVAATIGIAVFSAVVGFVWLPSAQSDAQFQGLWNAICSAAGVPQTWLIGTPVTSTVRTSQVELTSRLLKDVTPVSIGRGATLAMRCTMCHGERGMSEANSPNLAGQYPVVIYKELIDFQTGARTNAVMTPMAMNLSDQDMRDLAAYYAYLPRPPAARASADEKARGPDIVMTGAPMRNIAPCASCHGGIDNKVGSPWLYGLPAAYTKAQLEAFKAGTRRNDISGQMRNVARQMTAAEIDEAAAYYAAAGTR